MMEHTYCSNQIKEVWQFDGGSATSTGSGVAIRYRIQI